MQAPDLVEIARFRRRSAADERALVVAAMGVPYWLLQEDERYLLCVSAPDAEAARAELEKFEGERTLRPQRLRDEGQVAKIPAVSLFVFAWVLMGAFVFQQWMPRALVEKGAASSRAILDGEIWRTVTALTLHGDAAHLGANLATGLLFAAFLLPLLGTGATWFGFLLSGAVGNWLNALGHRGEEHVSIGASTAVFGALGLLVGCQLHTLFSARTQLRLWEVLVPIGGGLALLAFLGVGDERVDFMAHFWGLLAGIGIGVPLAYLRPAMNFPSILQRSLAAAAVLIVAAAWFLTWRG